MRRHGSPRYRFEWELTQTRRGETTRLQSFFRLFVLDHRPRSFPLSPWSCIHFRPVRFKPRRRCSLQASRGMPYSRCEFSGRITCMGDLGDSSSHDVCGLSRCACRNSPLGGSGIVFPAACTQLCGGSQTGYGGRCREWPCTKTFSRRRSVIVKWLVYLEIMLLSMGTCNSGLAIEFFGHALGNSSNGSVECGGACHIAKSVCGRICRCVECRCGDDYCPKRPPRLCLPRQCGLCDDYCPKPWPCVHWPPACGYPDYYKCPPVRCHAVAERRFTGD